MLADHAFSFGYAKLNVDRGKICQMLMRLLSEAKENFCAALNYI